MKMIRHISVVVILLGIGGAGLFVALFARHGLSDIAGAVAAAGWGVAAVIAFHLVPLFFDVLSWKVVIPPKNRIRFCDLFWIRWMGDSVSAMLPVAQVGGEIVRVRLAATRGIPLPIAAGSVLVGMTVSVATQIIFTLSGLAALMLATGHSRITGSAVAGALIAVAAVGGFYAVQRFGIFRIIGAMVSYVVGPDGWGGLVARGQALDRELRALYSRRSAVAACCLWNMCTWATGAVEVWIALWALGSPGTYVQAYVLESMGQGIRSVMFLVPGAIGVQEGGYLVVGAMLGIPAETALALALIRRARELAFGVPGVIAWQWVEGKRWLGRRELRIGASEVPASVTGKVL